jgi:hypothetical protein
MQHLLPPLPVTHNQLTSELNKTYILRTAVVNVWGKTKLNLQVQHDYVKLVQSNRTA